MSFRSSRPARPGLVNGSELRSPLRTPLSRARSGWVEIRPFRGDLRKFIRLQDGDATPLKPDPSALCPLAQLLVRALPRPADDGADLTLGDRQLARRGAISIGCKTQQRLRQSNGQV